MNKKSKLAMWASLVFTAVSLTSCGVVAGVIDVKRELEQMPMEVTLTDGTVLPGTGRMPNAKTKKLTFTSAQGEKQKIESQDIDYLEAWNDKSPDERFTMVYKNKTWMIPHEAGKHLIVFASSTDFYVNSKGVMTLKGEHIYYYGIRPGDDECTLIATTGYVNTKKIARGVLLELLEADPAICARIKNKEIDVLDFETICNEYNPTK